MKQKKRSQNYKGGGGLATQDNCHPPTPDPRGNIFAIWKLRNSCKYDGFSIHFSKGTWSGPTTALATQKGITQSGWVGEGMEGEGEGVIIVTCVMDICSIRQCRDLFGDYEPSLRPFPIQDAVPRRSQFNYWSTAKGRGRIARVCLLCTTYNRPIPFSFSKRACLNKQIRGSRRQNLLDAAPTFNSKLQ